MALVLVSVPLGLAFGWQEPTAASAGARSEDGFSDLTEPVPAVALRPERLEEIGEYECASCHTAVANEWAITAHATAWVDELYQEALAEKKRPQSCYGCHAPQPVLAGEKLRRPRSREEDRHLGVSCEACHVAADGAVLGPRGTEVDAHPSRLSEHVSGTGSSAVCVTCHATNIGPVIGIAKDFVETKRAERGESCVGCHMAPVERAWADGEGVPVRQGRSHLIQTPRDPGFLRRAFEVSWDAAGGAGRVVLRNLAGHRVPGLIGRELRFTARVTDAAGQVVDEAELVIDANTYLPVDGTRELPLTKAGAEVHLVGVHVDPRAEEGVTFLDEKLAPLR